MAFAVALANGEAGLEKCPHLSDEEKAALSPMIKPVPAGAGFMDSIEALRQKVEKLSFDEIAERLGAEVVDGCLSVRCLGREFLIGPEGELRSSCHVNYWMQTILYNYCLSGGDGVMKGEWVPFETLKGGHSSAPYFRRRCLEPLHAIADSHTKIFLELLEIFGGGHVTGFDADHSVVLRPVPKVPLLINYWEDEEGFGSRLSILFDRSADAYFKPEVITLMGRGIVQMFQSIIPRHEEIMESIRYL